MSSSNKKTFKTSENSKQAGSTVTSDAILLEPTTTDHILVVTSNSSANLTGDVDVELEMSPDGQNWCPAKVSEIVTTTTNGGGGPTDPTPAIIGNEKAVNLATAGINDPTTPEARNKAARGRKEYNLLNDQLYSGLEPSEPNRTNAADFMHHMIAVDKSFNYSGWYKPTSELPSSTYKPVIFRHGGHDPFENTKVVELTDSVTQNLCEPLQTPSALNTKVLDGISSTSTTQPDFSMKPLGTNATTNISVFPELSDFYSTTLNACVMGNLSDPRSISFWIKIDSLVSNHTAVWQQGSGAGGSIGITVYNGTVRLQFQHSSQATGADYSQVISSTISTNTWTHITFRKPTGTTGAVLEAIVNGNIANKTTATMPSAGSINLTRWTTSNQLTFSRFSSYIVNVATGTLFRGTCAIEVSDFMAFKDYLHDDEVTALYNQGKPVDPTSIPVAGNVNIPSKIDSWFRFGDGPTDVVDTVTPSYKAYNQITNAYRTSVGRPTIQNDPAGQYIENNTSVTGPSFSSLSQNDPIFSGYVPALTSIFTSTSSFSISGWFKTEVGATGTLFSNMDSSGKGMQCILATSILSIEHFDSGYDHNDYWNTLYNDGEWHHIVYSVDNGNGNQKLYIDGSLKTTGIIPLTDNMLRGNYGFTLLGDGQNNAHATSPSSTDSSKLNATLSNWSIHSEALDEYAIKQLYSNGHVRNAMNLPSIDSTKVEAFWQLNDQTTPEQDSSGKGHNLTYQDGNSPAKTLVDPTILVPATGATLTERQINGNAMTLSITKSFDLGSEQWVTDSSGDSCFCLSFNGFQEQAEYFILWKCNQVSKGVNFLDGNWHNIVLSYRASTQEGDIVRCGLGSDVNNTTAFNWNLSIDGRELNNINGDIGADYIGGLGNGLVLDADGVTNAGFTIYNRHLKYDPNNNQEEYKSHCQGADGISISSAEDNIYAFQSFIDETSFHSQNFWETNGGIDPKNFESEYPATIYGNTTGLSGTRGSGATYATGIPYPLNDPDAIGAVPGTSQYINPNRYDLNTNPGGGLEAWWRWGDTLTDCAENINDAIDYSIDPTVNNHDLRTINIDQQGDPYTLTTSDSVYLASQEATPGSPGGGSTTVSTSIELVNAVIESIVNTACNVKDLNTQILQYLRVKFTGAGSTELGNDKTEASIWWRKKE